ncbi:MAG: hydroxyacid dehydrogenase [Candidatus Omnitrophica bacterium]|nr:hydroxyacid dehydrogenase [Candidatus Omnitrophota bacterium]
MNKSKPLVGFFEVEPWEKTVIRHSALKSAARAAFFREPLHVLSPKEIARFEAVSVFIYSKVDAQAIRRMPKLKLIATRSTGYDHIDLKAAARRKIAVANVPFYGENTVAEHTFALILSLSRGVHKAYMKTTRGDFSLEGLQGFDLKGKTLGVIGAGHIGLHVIKMAKGFGMEVVAYDTRRQPFLAEVLDFKYIPLEDLLKISDIVTLHTPYLPSTHHLINRRTIRMMKKGALLINTARGGLVDTDALVWALDEGLIGGAALDVLEGEDLIKEERQLLSSDFSKERLVTALKNHILLHRENVVITPHTAFYSKEALQRIVETTISNILHFFKETPANLVRRSA